MDSNKKINTHTQLPVPKNITNQQAISVNPQQWFTFICFISNNLSIQYCLWARCYQFFQRDVWSISVKIQTKFLVPALLKFHIHFISVSLLWRQTSTFGSSLQTSVSIPIKGFVVIHVICRDSRNLSSRNFVQSSESFLQDCYHVQLILFRKL